MCKICNLYSFLITMFFRYTNQKRMQFSLDIEKVVIVEISRDKSVSHFI